MNRADPRVPLLRQGVNNVAREIQFHRRYVGTLTKEKGGIYHECLHC